MSTPGMSPQVYVFNMFFTDNILYIYTLYIQPLTWGHCARALTWHPACLPIIGQPNSVTAWDVRKQYTAIVNMSEKSSLEIAK